MEYSDAGLAMTKEFEGLRLSAYQDVVSVWTVGYGHTGTDVHAGLTITQTEADALLREDLSSAIATVNKEVTVPLTQNQFDALVDFCFNAGSGNFQHSTLLRNVNRGDFAGVETQFGLWTHAGGKVEPGLVRRRKAEATLFAKPNEAKLSA
jgi:lysozyme